MARRGKGEGSIYQRKDGRWEGAITTGTTEAGNPRRTRQYGKTRKEVAEKLAKLQAEQLSGTLSAPDKTTIAEWMRQWLEHKRAAIRPKTYDIYCNQIERHILPVVGTVRVQQLKPAQVRDLYASWGKKGMASSSQRATANRLKAALKEAQQLEIIARNPAEAVKLQVAPIEKCAKVWEPQEVRQFLDTAEGDPLYPVFFLMLTLALRRGEALGLRWCDFDAKRRVLKIQQDLTVARNKATIAKLKTKASQRKLHLPPDVVRLLEAHKTKQEEVLSLLGKGWEDEGLMFTTSKATPLHPRNFHRSYQRLVGEAGLRYIRPHDMRHTSASLALCKGMSVNVVSERLGHSRVAFTLDTYRHLYDAEREEGALSLGDLLNEPEPDEEE